jgi:hypothetical protein
MTALAGRRNGALHAHRPAVSTALRRSRNERQRREAEDDKEDANEFHVFS